MNAEGAGSTAGAQRCGQGGHAHTVLRFLERKRELIVPACARRTSAPPVYSLRSLRSCSSRVTRGTSAPPPYSLRPLRSCSSRCPGHSSTRENEPSGGRTHDGAAHRGWCAAPWCSRSADDRDRAQYMPPMPPPGPPAGAAGLSSFFSTISASVVRSSPEIEAAFCSAVRVTLVGSMTPACTRSS